MTAHAPRSVAFSTIAECIEVIQATGSEVRDVSPARETFPGDDVLRVRFTVTLPELSELASMGLSLVGNGITITDEGECVLEFTVEVPLDDSVLDGRRERTVSQVEETVDNIEISPRPPDSTKLSAERSDDVEPCQAVQEEQVPSDAIRVNEPGMEDKPGQPDDVASTGEPTKAYRDPERLRAVYGEFESFSEMRDALGVDVTPQTVRRHMIRHGIHEVSSNPTQDALKAAAMDRELSSQAPDNADESSSHPAGGHNIDQSGRDSSSTLPGDDAPKLPTD